MFSSWGDNYCQVWPNWPGSSNFRSLKIWGLWLNFQSQQVQRKPKFEKDFKSEITLKFLVRNILLSSWFWPLKRSPRQLILLTKMQNVCTKSGKKSMKMVIHIVYTWCVKLLSRKSGIRLCSNSRYSRFAFQIAVRNIIKKFSEIMQLSRVWIHVVRVGISFAIWLGLILPLSKPRYLTVPRLS